MPKSKPTEPAKSPALAVPPTVIKYTDVDGVDREHVVPALAVGDTVLRIVARDPLSSFEDGTQLPLLDATKGTVSALRMASVDGRGIDCYAVSFEGSDTESMVPAESLDRHNLPAFVQQPEGVAGVFYASPGFATMLKIFILSAVLRPKVEAIEILVKEALQQVDGEIDKLI